VIAIVDNRSVLDGVALVLAERRASFEEKGCQSASEKKQRISPGNYLHSTMEISSKCHF
jgi:hypothetical protein